MRPEKQWPEMVIECDEEEIPCNNDIAPSSVNRDTPAASEVTAATEKVTKREEPQIGGTYSRVKKPQSHILANCRAQWS